MAGLAESGDGHFDHVERTAPIQESLVPWLVASWDEFNVELIGVCVVRGRTVLSVHSPVMRDRECNNIVVFCPAIVGMCPK